MILPHSKKCFCLFIPFIPTLRFLMWGGIGFFLFAIPFLAHAVSIPDPLQADSPYEVVARVIRGFLGLVGVLALLNFVLAGIGLIYSRGNSEKVQKHKENLLWTILGMALLFGAYAIVSYVIEKLSGASI